MWRKQEIEYIIMHKVDELRVLLTHRNFEPETIIMLLLFSLEILVLPV
jgi:hypothetical protein